MADSVVDANNASESEISAALGFTDGDETNEDESSTGEHGDEGQEPSNSIDDLPDWAQKTIKDLRSEAAANRVKAREKARKAAETKSAADPKDLTAAEERGREAARLEYGIRLAGAEVKAALVGVIPDDRIEDVIDDLNLSRYVGDDGEVDTEAVKALRDKYAALVNNRKTTKVNHGRTGTAPSTKSTADQFADVFKNL